jgi:dissimilatory sulfite reductase (desulfoviridin) alpha/beta subunit
MTGSMFGFLRRAKKERLPWNQDALAMLSETPAPLRPMVRGKIEEAARGRGALRVGVQDVLNAREAFEARFRKTTGKTPGAASMPAPNVPGAPMVLVSACHGQAVGCRNPVLNTEEWKTAIEEWAARTGLSERIRARVPGDTLFMHHKVKFSISGCPNGCSRPQIADFGFAGTLTPCFSREGCAGCGACAEACPDKALSMADGFPVRDPEKCQGCLCCARACAAGCVSHAGRGARLLAGGKLGRHPHLGDMAGVFETPGEALAVVERIVDLYLAKAVSEERFATWWTREGAEEILGGL